MTHLLTNAIDLQKYPLDKPGSPEWRHLTKDCSEQLGDAGMFTLPGFLQQQSLTRLTNQLTPAIAQESFEHSREHNIYFSSPPAELPANHSALTTFKTTNHTLCADQLTQTVLYSLYKWPEFAAFLAQATGKPQLFTMADPLAAVNVMAYSEGEALNWHFDRAEFTTTLLIQAPDAGGEFEYKQNLRTDSDPNFDRVGRLLTGLDKPTVLPLTAGSLNVFKGKNTAHRVSPVKGDRQRLIAVFSYFDVPDVTFSENDRLQFYGRTR